MKTDFNINEKVVCHNIFLLGKIVPNVYGIIKCIYIDDVFGVQYCVQLYYPKGTMIRNVDVSYEEAINRHLIKEKDISKYDPVKHAYLIKEEEA